MPQMGSAICMLVKQLLYRLIIKGLKVLALFNYNLPFMLEKPYFCQIEWLFLNLDKITRFTFFVGEDVRIKLQENSGGLPANVIL